MTAMMVNASSWLIQTMFREECFEQLHAQHPMAIKTIMKQTSGQKSELVVKHGKFLEGLVNLVDTFDGG